MESVNRMAIELVDEALDFAEELGIGAYELDGGGVLLDFGVEFDGGIEAGLLLVEVQTAGLATVQSRVRDVAGATLPHVDLTTDHPALALLCCQKAGWELRTDDFEGLGSGPARALVGEEEEFARVGYHDAFDLTALSVEAESLPDEAVAEQVADRTGVEPGSVYLLAHPTASIVGSVTSAARAAELAVFRLFELGYDPLDVVTATASAPVPPVSADEGTAIGRATDALAYGGRVHLTLREEPDRLDEVPSIAAEEFGRPLVEVFDEHDWEFDALPVETFGPATVTVDVLGGQTRTVGERREDLLAASFGI